MFQALQILTLVLVATVLALSLAHVAEWPGKQRLNKDTYLAVQQIYYPGFTIGGVSEPLSVLALIALAMSTERASPALVWTLGALAAMVAVQLVFWFFTQPVNKIWLQDQKLAAAGEAFFASGPQRHGADSADWTALRNRWEFSHAVRAFFAVIGFVCLGVAVTSHA